MYAGISRRITGCVEQSKDKLSLLRSSFSLLGEFIFTGSNIVDILAPNQPILIGRVVGNLNEIRKEFFKKFENANKEMLAKLEKGARSKWEKYFAKLKEREFDEPKSYD